MESTIEQIKRSHPDVEGWGVDANLENDPTYPIKRRTNAEHKGYSWERPQQQPSNVEVLHSNERPNLTAAFGTSTPPSGLSGMLRRFAFRFSESSYGHWLPLMLADRINVVEGCIDDLRHGKVPNLIAECGWRAEWQHNRKAFVTRLTLRALFVGGIVAGTIAMNRRSRRNPRE